MKYQSLKTGDIIKINKVSESDIRQRKHEIEQSISDAGWTANTIELIIQQCPIVTIDWIDEYGLPWYEATIRNPHTNKEENHYLAIDDDESWELISS